MVLELSVSHAHPFPTAYCGLYTCSRKDVTVMLVSLLDFSLPGEIYDERRVKTDMNTVVHFVAVKRKERTVNTIVYFNRMIEKLI